MEKVVTIFEDDWRRIPAKVRYFFFGGVFFIAIAWIGDHWKDNLTYNFPLIGNRNAFTLGIVLIVIFFSILFVKQLFLWGKIFYLRRLYPFKTLYVDFYLVSVGGYVYLLDVKKKKRFHLKNPQTVMDLDFWMLGWVSYPDPAKPDDQILVGPSGLTVRWADYQDVPGGIFTQF